MGTERPSRMLSLCVCAQRPLSRTTAMDDSYITVAGDSVGGAAPDRATRPNDGALHGVPPTATATVNDAAAAGVENVR
jgi:hypothetical protein